MWTALIVGLSILLVQTYFTLTFLSLWIIHDRDDYSFWPFQVPLFCDDLPLFVFFVLSLSEEGNKYSNSIRRTIQVHRPKQLSSLVERTLIDFNNLSLPRVWSSNNLHQTGVSSVYVIHLKIENEMYDYFFYYFFKTISCF